MPLGESKRAAGLEAVVGICDDGEAALFDGIPVPVSGDVAPGVEVGASGGYERQPLTSADWVLDGAEIGVTLDFGPASDAWDASPRYWAWLDGSDVVQMWGQLRVPVAVEAAVTSVPVELAVVWVDPTQSTEE